MSFRDRCRASSRGDVRRGGALRGAEEVCRGSPPRGSFLCSPRGSLRCSLRSGLGPRSGRGPRSGGGRGRFFRAGGALGLASAEAGAGGGRSFRRRLGRGSSGGRGRLDRRRRFGAAPGGVPAIRPEDSGSGLRFRSFYSALWLAAPIPGRRGRRLQLQLSLPASEERRLDSGAGLLKSRWRPSESSTRFNRRWSRHGRCCASDCRCWLRAGRMRSVSR